MGRLPARPSGCPLPQPSGYRLASDHSAVNLKLQIIPVHIVDPGLAIRVAGANLELGRGDIVPFKYFRDLVVGQIDTTRHFGRHERKLDVTEPGSTCNDRLRCRRNLDGHNGDFRQRAPAFESADTVLDLSEDFHAGYTGIPSDESMLLGRFSAFFARVERHRPAW